MRVIIAGGTGLIGSDLAKWLDKAGYEVIVLSRNPNKQTKLPASIQITQWDAKTANGWGELANGAKAIINLAGASLIGDGLLPTRWSAERKQLIRDSRQWACNGVVQAIEQAEEKPERLIQASAIGYYGTHEDDRTLTESAPAGDDFFSDNLQRLGKWGEECAGSWQ